MDELADFKQSLSLPQSSDPELDLFDEFGESGDPVSMERLIEEVLASSSLIEQGLFKSLNHQALLRAK
jgi:hypothetical protein